MPTSFHESLSKKSRAEFGSSVTKIRGKFGLSSHMSACVAHLAKKSYKLGHLLKQSASAFPTVAITSFACPLKRFSCRRAMLDAGPRHAVRSYSAPIGWPAPKTALPLVREMPCDQHAAFHLPPITRGAQHTFVRGKPA